MVDKSDLERGFAETPAATPFPSVFPVCGLAHRMGSVPRSVGWYDYAVPGGPPEAVARLFVCEAHAADAERAGHEVHLNRASRSEAEGALPAPCKHEWRLIHERLPMTATDGMVNVQVPGSRRFYCVFCRLVEETTA